MSKSLGNLQSRAKMEGFVDSKRVIIFMVIIEGKEKRYLDTVGSLV